MCTDLKMALKITKFILAFIAVILLILGTAANSGGENDADAEDTGERMMEFAWNKLEVTGPGIEDSGLFIGFHGSCAYGCSNGNCGASCGLWSEDDGYDQYNDFCDDSGARETAENAFNYAISAGGGGNGKADGFADVVCSCWSMQFAVPVLLWLAGILLIVDLILTGIRFCNDNKCLFVSSIIMTILSAIFALSAIMAYGIGCNLNAYPEAMLAWGASYNPSVATVAGLIAAGVYDYEGAWGAGFFIALFGMLLAIAIAAITPCSGSYAGDCCSCSSSTSSSASSASQAPPAAMGTPVPAQPAVEMQQAKDGPKFCPQCGSPLAPGAKFCPTTGVALFASQAVSA